MVYTDNLGNVARSTVPGTMNIGRFIESAKRIIEKGIDLDVMVIDDNIDANKSVHDVKTTKNICYFNGRSDSINYHVIRILLKYLKDLLLQLKKIIFLLLVLIKN